MTTLTAIKPLFRTSRRRPRLRWLLRAASLITALLLWQWLTAADIDLWLRFDRLPTSLEVADQLTTLLREPVFYQDIAQSLVRILTGFALAAVLGIGAGIAVARSWLLADLLQPLFEVVRPIPAIALVPVAILIFPQNEQGIVFITCTAAFFPILVSTRHAVRALPTVWEDAVRTMGGSRWRVLVSVVLPGALPGVFGGLSVGMGVAWICVISAEMISGDFGVGYRTWHAYTIVDYPAVLVGMITIGVLGWATAGTVELLGRRVTRWLPKHLREER
ncbi:NitT/TauT family transport system permease protein [Actinoplanes octamycinicus]|uniref:NitT/TauT family transport system permease protein n=1 Tax=Actinoplanes octamycinicus TaxID=135948 RepID=A0A7W7GZE5_9ACTN|nr:ABC transporter permease [Actinoplanes octamycinicus]MBB4741131.1 NitT/TauT family transport system permease protein [Actinoplanes octamycinicus]GIE56038.1 putative nitrate ABC transporter, permease protein [Actinoplanes octamycinicus]